MSQLKKLFIRGVLEEEGRRYLSNQGREIRAKLHFHTRRLFNDRTMNVVSASDRYEGKLIITFPNYLRLLDARRNVKDRTGKRSRKGYQLYNKFAMGHYYAIAHRLQNDFTDDVALNLRRQWQQSNP
ncbi:hypothetical protein AAW12_15940 [Sphingobacterium sp. Ag1]|uniref:hypothetical protein n=1 Tax=Sphingobacterium sp. Ag1 TaxID=1643451 RepID=UPI0006281FB4|nr:hypothetical protein [Sphingobacterium sp. Ag1]KKO90568.1 hypothetical protein AAW12_15940 [Sphingobacterium sp. Ag1]